MTIGETGDAGRDKRFNIELAAKLVVRYDSRTRARVNPSVNSVPVGTKVNSGPPRITTKARCALFLRDS